MFPLRMVIMRLVFNGASSCYLKFLTGTIFFPQITSTMLQESLNPYKSKTFVPVANYLIISIITGRLRAWIHDKCLATKHHQTLFDDQTFYRLDMLFGAA